MSGWSEVSIQAKVNEVKLSSDHQNSSSLSQAQKCVQEWILEPRVVPREQFVHLLDSSKEGKARQYGSRKDL
jgi:hypothetical protein